MKIEDYRDSPEYKKSIENYRKKIKHLVEEELERKKVPETNKSLEEFQKEFQTEESVRERYKSKLQKKLEAEGDYKYSIAQTPSISKGQQFDEAWRNLIHYGDSKLFDEIVHEDYYTINQGVKLNKETSRRVLMKRKGQVVMGPFEILYENHEFVGIQRYSRVNLYTWFSMISCVKYKDGKVFTQSTVREPLQVDPSKEEGWSWNDYKP